MAVKMTSRLSSRRTRNNDDGSDNETFDYESETSESRRSAKRSRVNQEKRGSGEDDTKSGASTKPSPQRNALSMVSKWASKTSTKTIAKKKPLTVQKKDPAAIPKKRKIADKEDPDSSLLVHNLTAASTSIPSKPSRSNTPKPAPVDRSSSTSQHRQSHKSSMASAPSRQATPPRSSSQGFPGPTQHPSRSSREPRQQGSRLAAAAPSAPQHPSKNHHQQQPFAREETHASSSPSKEEREVMSQLDSFCQEAGDGITRLRIPPTMTVSVPSKNKPSRLDPFGSWLNDREDGGEPSLDFFDTNEKGQILLYPLQPMFPEDFPPGLKEHPLSWWGVIDPICGQGKYSKTPQGHGSCGGEPPSNVPNERHRQQGPPPPRKYHEEPNRGRQQSREYRQNNSRR